MPDIYCSHFTYNGVSSRNYFTNGVATGRERPGLIISSIETSRFTGLEGETSSVNVFNRKHRQRNYVATDYTSSPLTFDVEIITDDERPMTDTNRREVEKWLFDSHGYKRLYFDATDTPEAWEPVRLSDVAVIQGNVRDSLALLDENDQVVDERSLGLYLNCRFINPKKLEYNGGIVGYIATLEADSDMLWQDAIFIQATLVNISAPHIITLTVNTDKNDYTYPVIEIGSDSAPLVDEDGYITLRNMTDNEQRRTKFDIPATIMPVKFTVDSVYNTVTKFTDPSESLYDYMDGYLFPRLLDGRNRLSVNGDVTGLRITYNNRRRF